MTCELSTWPASIATEALLHRVPEIAVADSTSIYSSFCSVDTVCFICGSGSNKLSTSVNARLMQASGYVAAFLPGGAIYFSSRVHVLHRTPLALSFVLVGIIARIYGRGPSILAPIITALYFNYVVALPAYAWAASPAGMIETSIILALGFAIAYLFQGQRNAEQNLRSANKALAEKTNALVQAQQGSKSAAWSFNTYTRQTSWYEGGSELFGRSLAEITALGSPTSLLVEEDRPKVAAAAAQTAKTGEPFRVEFRVLWPNGEIHWLEACGTPKPSDPSIWMGVTMDITNRKTAELALIRSEKLLVTSRLASSVSHEINNPLEAITNLIYLAKSKAANEEARTYLKEAENELARIAYITNQSLRFHRQQSAPIAIDIAETIREVVRFYEPRMSAGKITLDLDLQPLPEFLCRASEIRQLFGNLIQNGLEAMPKGGHMRLRVRPCTDWRNGARGVRVTIANTGNGMSMQTRKRIYEPFFTTKDGTNTGLGLWVAAGIVDRHGGSIQVWSSTNPESSGTAFSVVLPLRSTPLSGNGMSNLDLSLATPEYIQPAH
jgi:PAS domain S-box-containing protein